MEEAADSFFLDGIAEQDGLDEILQSIFGQLDLLYEYDCERQFGRSLTSDEQRHRSLVLDSAPDATGHRPLVFRALSLVRSILRIRPELDTTTFIDEYAASLEGR